MENTMTEQDLDGRFEGPVTAAHPDHNDIEPDLAVDGLSDSLLSRFIRLITFR